jgi:hypothetical protein
VNWCTAQHVQYHHSNIGKKDRAVALLGYKSAEPTPIGQNSICLT